MVDKIDWYEKEFKEIAELIKNSQFLDLCQFLRVRNFKIQNSAITTNQEIKEKTEESFKLAQNDEIEEAIMVLCDVHGVAVPMASTILAMRFPDKYEIIDINVITALNKEEKWKKYKNDPKIYVEYLKIIREKSKEEGKTLRDLELELFKREKASKKK